MSVWLLLLLDHRNVSVTHLLQGAGHWLQPRTIQRAVHDGYILVDALAKQDRLILDLFYKCSVDLIRNIPDATVCHACFKVAGLNVRKDVKFFNLSKNLRRCFGRNLTAVSTIDLVTIVFAGIVGSCHHDTCRSMQIASRKRYGRYRHQDRPDIDTDTICCKYPCCDFCKHIALDTAVVADCNRRFFKVFLQIVC